MCQARSSAASQNMIDLFFHNFSPAGSLQQRAAAAGAIQALAVRTSGNSALPPELQSEPVVHYVINIMHTTPRPMQCATAGVVCNLASGLPEAEVGWFLCNSHLIFLYALVVDIAPRGSSLAALAFDNVVSQHVCLFSSSVEFLQALMSEDGAIEVLTDLLSDSQPDGQYSAAASLANLSVSQPGVLPMILDLGVLPPLFAMLEAKSWWVMHTHYSLFNSLPGTGSFCAKLTLFLPELAQWACEDTLAVTGSPAWDRIFLQYHSIYLLLCSQVQFSSLAP